MDSKLAIISKRLRPLRWVLVGSLVGYTVAAPAVLTVPNKPLFLANDVQANIFFALDDSGSMDWEIVLSDGAMAAFPTASDGGYLDLTPNNATADFVLCAGYNTLAYDPNITYSPWMGVGNNGNPFQGQVISTALDNPYDTTGTSQNLLDAYASGIAVGYGTWVDGSGGGTLDGIFQNGECPTSDTATGDYTVRAPNYTDTRWVFVDTLNAAQQTNFANWYSYYRKREYVLKHAVSELVTNSTQRMGLATLHNNNAVGTAVADMTIPTAKATLLNNLFQVYSIGGTPLRSLLDRTGKYFDQTDAGDTLHSALGFSSPSPILSSATGGECQQNFAILFSDGFWNGAAPSVGNTDQDGASAWDGGPHADTYDNTLADVAMHYYETDLSNLANKVAVLPNVDENSAQHLVTYSVAFGLSGSLNASPADHAATTAPPPWPLPLADTVTTIDDMRHAAFNGRGLYLSGQDPQQLAQNLNDAITDIGNRTGTASAAAATSQSLRADSLIFQGTFDTDGWDGDLFAVRFLDGGIIGPRVWGAAAGIPAEASRSIFTWVNAGVVDGAAFEWLNLTAALQTSIGSEAILDYIRGDQTNEMKNSGAFRNRDSLLGDIIHSPPVTVTKSQSSPPYQLLGGSEGSTFNTYLASKLTRQDMVYAGANDGMLHAFRISDGVEEFAFVPQATFANLATLSDPNYEHRFFVDGPLRASDVYINSGWKSVLVGALGRGGAGLFALNVSTPATFDENDVLWEYNHAELGIVIGKLQIVRLNNDKWAAIIGNGYNSTSERAQLFVIDIETGTLIKQFDTGAGDATNSNGLATPLVVDTNGNFTGDYVYAGDLLGNMWKFDLTDANPSNWSVANSGAPLYTALAPSGNPQAITTKPAIVVNPNGGSIILFGTGRFFAGGDDILSATPEVETFYGIWDNGASVASVGGRPLPGSNTQPTNVLQPQEFIEEDVDTFGSELKHTRTLTQHAVDYTTQKGWYLDLVSPTNGAQSERVVADPVITISNDNSPLILFNTFAPSGGCESVGGFSVLMAFDPINGGRTEFAVFDLNEDGEFTSADAQSDGSGGVNHDSGLIGGGTLVPPSIIASNDGTVNHAVSSGLDGSTTVNNINGAAQSLGRQSWRQLK